MTAETVRRATSILVEACRSGVAIDGLPADARPETVEDAYAIQDAVSSEMGAIAGWKVSIARPGAPSQCAPILRKQTYGNGSVVPTTHVDAVEIEIGFRFKQDLAPATSWDEDAVAQALGSVSAAIEIVGSRFRDSGAMDKLSLLADAQKTAGMILCEPGSEWPSIDLASATFWLEVDGQPVQRRGADVPMKTHLGALTWLVNELGRRGHVLKADQLVITGARVGPEAVRSGSVVSGGASGLGQVRVRFAD